MYTKLSKYESHFLYIMLTRLYYREYMNILINWEIFLENGLHESLNSIQSNKSN